MNGETIRRWTTALLLAVISMTVSAEKTFFLLNQEQGLRGRRVFQVIQLADGRMAVDTESDICLYDGAQFTPISKTKKAYHPLPGYREYTRLYVDNRHRLWIKDTGKAACLDLTRLRWMDWRRQKDMQSADNILADSKGNLWTVRGRRVSMSDEKVTCSMTRDDGDIQDIDNDGQWIYVFTSNGAVTLYNAANGDREISLPAYAKEERASLKDFSLVTKSGDSFYQLRMGWGHAVCQQFDTKTRQWKRLLDCNYALHTLTVSGENKLYISSAKGYWIIDLKDGTRRLLSTLRLPDGSRLKTGFNTICQDREGGIWLGSYNRGIFYSSPLNSLFDTRERETTLTPILLSAYLKGSQLHIGEKSMDKDAPFLRQLTMAHDDNSLAFYFSAMKFVRPCNIYYRYRICEVNSKWCTVSANTTGNNVDERGRLYLSFVNLSPGTYTIEVMASSDPHTWNGDCCRLQLIIRHPWWDTGWAYTAYLLLTLGIITVTMHLYTRGVRQKAERRQREDRLLMQIQSLVEKCNLLESSANLVLTDKEENDDKPQMSEEEIVFLNRATRLVEENLSNASYTVEQLSGDLCMERTGLYKKLTALMDKSPVAFIRSIRLARAADMLSHGGYTVADVAERTGFGSAGYFNKCFQRQYGCKPSEYNNLNKTGQNRNK